MTSDSELFGRLVGLIEMKGHDVESARQKLIAYEDVDAEQVDELIASHWE